MTNPPAMQPTPCSLVFGGCSRAAAGRAGVSACRGAAARYMPAALMDVVPSLAILDGGTTSSW